MDHYIYWFSYFNGVFTGIGVSFAILAIYLAHRGIKKLNETEEFIERVKQELGGLNGTDKN